MELDVTTSERNKSPEDEKDMSVLMKHLTVNAHGSNEHLHKNSTLAASLLLPTPMNGPKSTSAMMAEKANFWSENKLHEKNTLLDKQLYHNMVKLNADRLEVVNDLARLKRSSSAGSLNKHDDTKSHSKPRSHCNSPVTEKKRVISSIASASRKSVNDNVNKKPERFSGIEIRITSDFSSDDEDVQDNVHLRCASSPTVRRHCREERSQGDMVENVLRRYARQTSPKSGRNTKR